MREYTYIDLFSGPGGLCTGFISEGFVPRIAVEWSDTTVVTYAKSHDAEIYELQDLLANLGQLENILKKTKKTCLIHGDINQVSNELIREILKKKFGETTVDVVTGGAPCESFSMAGKRLENDARNDLFSNILRIAHAVDSTYVLFENVPGLLSDHKGNTWKVMQNSFDSLGYYYKWQILNAKDYGIPQGRRRIYVVGFIKCFESKGI